MAKERVYNVNELRERESLMSRANREMSERVRVTVRVRERERERETDRQTDREINEKPTFFSSTLGGGGSL